MPSFEKPTSKKESSQEQKEKEEFSSRIQLRFMRHGEKEQDPSKKNVDIELTNKGKEQAKNMAEDNDISQSVAFGSPKKRTQETSALVIGGEIDEVTGKESLEELEEKLEGNLDKAKKIGTDERLDWSRNPLKAASQIADIINKYIEISSRWDKLSEKEKYDNTLKRVMATHLDVGENFLMSVIQKTEGEEKLREFAEKIKNNGGFNFTEGFEVDVLNKEDQEKPTVKVNYKKEEDGKTIFEFEKEIAPDLVEEIIEEGSN